MKCTNGALGVKIGKLRNVHEEERGGRSSVVTDEIVSEVDEKIKKKRRFTTIELSLSFQQISRSLFHEIVTHR